MGRGERFQARGKRGKRRRSREAFEDEPEDGRRLRQRRGQEPRSESRGGQRPISALETGAEQTRWRRSPHEPRSITCLQCANLVITRSIVKLIGQSWEEAVSYPTYSCFEQRWTVENPAATGDLFAVSPYLVGGAESCPTYRRGQARDYRPGYGW